jgi:hypothetical protein
MLFLFAAGSSPLPVAVRSHLLPLFTAIVCHRRNHCCHSAVSAVYCRRPRPILSMSLGCSSHLCNSWYAIAAAVSCLWQTSSSSLISHRRASCHHRFSLSEAEPCHLHCHLLSAGAANSCLQLSSPQLVFLNQRPPIKVGLCLSSLQP